MTGLWFWEDDIDEAWLAWHEQRKYLWRRFLLEAGLAH